jgi:hypothetical protein
MFPRVDAADIDRLTLNYNTYWFPGTHFPAGLTFELRARPVRAVGPAANGWALRTRNNLPATETNCSVLDDTTQPKLPYEGGA